MSVPLHATAVGKAYLSCLSDERVRDLIEEHGLPSVTASTIIERDELLIELEKIRNYGVAFDRGERVPGIRCVAAPVQTDSDEILGSVSISIPLQRANGDYFEEQLPEKVRNIARTIGLNVTYS